MKLSQRGASVIKTWEGLRLKAYLCPAGVPTIGYGHTATAKMGQTITTTEADALFKKDVAKFEKAVTDLVKVPLTQGQFDALVSFTYNVGVGAFTKSTLRRELNKGNHTAVPAQLRRWTKGDPKKPPLLGLVRRREAEIELWMSK